MKRLVLTAMLFAAAACASLDAQATGDLYVTVPFDFRVGTTLMPAGDYVIHQAYPVLTIRQLGGDAIITQGLPASRRAVRETGTVDFQRYGDAYFLATVWSPNSTRGFAMFRGPLEKELAKRVVPNQTASIATR